MKLILKSYARNISTEAPSTLLLEDIRRNSPSTMDVKTFESSIEALHDLFIIENLSAWNPNIRSKTSIRTSDTRHFINTSIACRLLNLSPENLLKDLHSFGFFFEDFAVRDLSIYASSLDGEIRHYRDNTGLECDAILHLSNGDCSAVEIKLGGETLIEEACQSLLRLKKKIMEKSDEREPKFLMVLVAFGPLYVRNDGIYVVPINCLKS